MSGHKPLPKPKDSITRDGWVKFVKGWATANETRTDRQVFHDDTERQRNWRNN
jgi:hypothetical protein